MVSVFSLGLLVSLLVYVSKCVNVHFFCGHLDNLLFVTRLEKITSWNPFNLLVSVSKCVVTETIFLLVIRLEKNYKLQEIFC